MVDGKHFSTSTVTREIKQKEVVAKAKRVPKLLLKLGPDLRLIIIKLLLYFILKGCFSVLKDFDQS